jgi:hypothetical protein
MRGEESPMSEPQRDLDPGEVVEASTVEQYEDPTDPEITDPDHPDYVEPGVEYGGES